MDVKEDAGAVEAASASDNLRLRCCCDCGAAISKYSAGRCRSCGARANLANPEMNARRLASLRVKLASPASRRKKKLARLKIEARRKGDLAWKEKKRLQGVRLRADYDASPEGQAKNLAKRGIAGEKTRDKLLAWCPVECRELNAILKRKAVPLEERKRLIAEEVERAKRQIQQRIAAQHARVQRDRAQAY